MARKSGITHELDDGTWDRLPIDHWTVVSKLENSDSEAYNRFFSLLDEYKNLRFHICSRVTLSKKDISSCDTEIPLEAVVAQLLPEDGYYLFIVVPAPNVPSGRFNRFMFYTRDHDVVSRYIAGLQG